MGLSDTRLPGKRPWTGIVTIKAPERHSHLVIGPRAMNLRLHGRITAHRHSPLTIRAMLILTAM